MSARLTDRTYAVHWDDPAELDAAIGGGPFRARLQVRDDGHLQRWNGFVCPHFTRQEIERYIAWVAAQPADHDYEAVSFDGDALVFGPSRQYPDEGPLDPIPPTADGLYPLGAFGWTWTVVPPDIDPEDDEPSFDEVEALGLDGTGRDLDPRFPYTLANLTHDETARLAARRWGNDVGPEDDAYWTRYRNGEGE